MGIILINQLRDQFIKEAISSPILFSDLANMEKYISESYQMRSVIELLQNADDAGSKNVKIILEGNTLFFANDGRDFNSEDLKSICRSGASTKLDRNKYIGYRGIGFKSVVNFSEEIHIFSENLSFSFSKAQTLKLINSYDINVNVPSIRIPYAFKEKKEYSEILNRLKIEGYKVIFIFENVKEDIIKQEIKDFSGNMLLFLKKINKVSIYINKKSEIYAVNREDKGIYSLITLKNNTYESSWIVLKYKDTAIHESIAFLESDTLENQPSIEENYLVYSFLPTKVNTGFKFIINGAFNTDPSRTQIILDDVTTESIKKVIELIVNAIVNFIEKSEKNIHIATLLNIIADIKEDPLIKLKNTLSFKDIFISELLKSLNEMKFKIGEKRISVNDIYIKPEWLNANDFSLICEELGYFNLDSTLKFPFAIKIFGQLDCKSLDCKDLINFNINISENGFSEIIKQYIKEKRFSLVKEDINKMKKSIIYSKLKDINYIEHLKKYIDEIDLSWFLSKIDLKENASKNSTRKIDLNISPSKINESFSSNFSKWRSVEMNVQAYYESLDDVVSVLDVSKSNLGYDLEVHWEHKIEFVEVKSVKNLGDSFSLTNNEYGVANEKEENYILAIVKQSDSNLEICFISNPINNLDLNRRVVRWEWVCDKYSGERKDFNLI